MLFHFHFRELSYNAYQNEYFRFCLENLNNENLAIEVEKKLEFIDELIINKIKKEESEKSENPYTAKENTKKKKGIFG